MGHHPPLPTRRVRAFAGLVAIGFAVAACTSAGTSAAPGGPSSSPAASAAAGASASTAPSPSPTVSPKPSPSPRITQTDTGWGRIWDAVPASFPLPAGASPVQPDRAASGAWSLSSGDAATVTSDLRSALEAAGYSTAGVSGPLEDGSRIIDSVGQPSTCHVQTRVTPLGTTITITVLFGAACPFR